MIVKGCKKCHRIYIYGYKQCPQYKSEEDYLIELDPDGGGK